jgi:hypothetical protein
MEFSNDLLVEISGHKLESFQTRVFVWFSTFVFPFYRMLSMNRLEFSCFADFFCMDFFNQSSVWFSAIEINIFLTAQTF